MELVIRTLTSGPPLSRAGTLETFRPVASPLYLCISLSFPVDFAKEIINRTYFTLSILSSNLFLVRITLLVT